MGQGLESLRVQPCPKADALRDCKGCYDQRTDTVNLAHLSSSPQGVDKLEPLQENAEYGNHSARSLKAASVGYCLPEPPVACKHAPPAPTMLVCGDTGNSDAHAEPPKIQLWQAELSSLDVDSVVAAMSASDVPDKVSPGRRSLATEAEPEEENWREPSSSSSTLSPSALAPNPDAVPSPGCLLLRDQAAISDGQPNCEEVLSTDACGLDEGRLRRASQLFVRMMRGDANTHRSRQRSRRRKSEPPRKDTGRVATCEPLPFVQVQMKSNVTNSSCRASSLDSFCPTTDAPAAPSEKLRPLNGEMPWFPPAPPQKKEPRLRSGVSKTECFH
eukprot:TRINITY_DN88787_c0_g1_i1.p1 TRINITY_DN88787_c0_g1~~TRINITY_DN88787_c0_g1_i1.p1  ORF type:complete len:330 (+),score=50.04 TRINITY_DN88787_c0_g1_i1:40-1029(+)